jgi:hypothetical protein
MTCAYGWAVSATAARTTKASLPKSGAQPGTKDIDREARESCGPTPRIVAAAAAPPCGYDQGLDQTPDTRAARRLMPGFSIRRDASSSKPGSCVIAGCARQRSQRTLAISNARVQLGPAKRRACSPERALRRQPMRVRARHTPIHTCPCKKLYATALRYDRNHCTRCRKLRLYVRNSLFVGDGGLSDDGSKSCLRSCVGL